MQPRWYQSSANAAVWNYLAEKPGNPLIVLPTGAGKSLVIAMLCKQAAEFGGRVIVLQHRKELIQQNTEKIQILLPEIKVGLYSAGLKYRQVDCDVMCAGIQSIYRKADEIGERHLVIVDEAHLISEREDSMYGQFLTDVKIISERSRVVGLTATPYRTGEGPICGSKKLFQRVVFEAQTKQLIDEGWLCPITNKPAEATVDTSGVKLRGGEFVESDLQSVFNVDDKVKAAVTEMVDKCNGRNSVLVFSSGVQHAENIATVLRSMVWPDRVEVVTGETLPIERSEILSAFKRGELRFLVNCDVLTTGFDAPCIDAICVLRATMSPGLFAQMVGRGLRKHESKQNCYVLDFGGNIKRHSSLDDPNYGRASVGGGKSSAADNNGRGKECPNCGLDVAARLSECMDCGFIFPAKDPRHGETADDESQLTGEAPPEQWIVSAVSWSKHTKRGDPDAPPTLRVNYDCVKDSEGLLKTQISEWICLEHQGFALQKARQWWIARSHSAVPETVESALSLLSRGACRMSSNITTKKEGKWYRITACSFVDERPEEWEEERERVEVSVFGDEVPF